MDRQEPKTQVSFADEDMQFIVTCENGNRYGLLHWGKRSTREVEFFECNMADRKWRPMKLRLGFFSWLNSWLWDSTWLPMSSSELHATAAGFTFEFVSNNFEGPVFRWRATCAAANRRVRLQRLNRVNAEWLRSQGT